MVQGLMTWSGLSGVGLVVLLSSGQPVLGQVIPDASLPLGERSLVTPGPDFQITGGATRGTNLFHSFQDFSVPPGGRAFFNNVANITNIISRVTGSTVSNIEGQIQANGTANLFLINPNGILFGPNAQLNVGGSFVAATANGIQFGTQGNFNTTTPSAPDLLTINPSALLFNQINAGEIRSQAALAVTPGQSLILAGRPLILDRATLLAPGGRVTLAGIAGTGSIPVNFLANGLGLRIPETFPLADVSLLNGSEVNVRAGGGGSITIQAQNLTIADASILRAGIAAQSGAPGIQAGDVEIRVPGTMTMTGGSFIANSTLGAGNSGNVNVQAGTVTLLNGSQINASTFGNGNGGTVSITARGPVIFDGEDNLGAPSGTFSQVNQTAIGDSGGIRIWAESVSVTNGAILTASTLGQGNAGRITIQSRGNVRFTGVRASDLGPSGAFSGVLGGSVGNSGGITIAAGSLSVENGAQLDASTSSFGNSGKITIQTTGAVKLGGILANGVEDPGGVYSFVGQQGTGNSGGISLTAGALSMVNGAAMVATTFGNGNAGDVSIRVTGPVVLDGQSPLFSTGVFSSVSPIARGNGGEIQLAAQSLTVTNGAAIAASTLGQGNAASITLAIQDSVIFDGVGRDGFSSGVFSRVGRRTARGNSGDINLSARFLALTNGGQLQASTEGQGNAGSIQVRVWDGIRVSGVDPQTRLASGFFSTTTPQSTGLAGDINVKAANLELLQGGVISSQSQGTGRSGSIVLALSDRLTARDGQILTSSTQSTGGAITITAKDIRLSRNSDITTSVFSGEGGGGNISLAARSIVLLDDSDILAFSRDGRGGNITLETPVFFAFRFQPAPPGTDPATLDGNGRVDINASGRLSAGIIALPDINELQSTVTELPAGLVDTNSLIASSCIARQARQGSFVVTGAGGFPTMPDDLASAPFPTYEIVPGPAAVARTPRSTPAIAEIDGVYRLGNGEIILGRACR